MFYLLNSRFKLEKRLTKIKISADIRRESENFIRRRPEVGKRSNAVRENSRHLNQLSTAVHRTAADGRKAAVGRVTVQRPLPRTIDARRRLGRLHHRRARGVEHGTTVRSQRRSGDGRYVVEAPRATRALDLSEQIARTAADVQFLARLRNARQNSVRGHRRSADLGVGQDHALYLRGNVLSQEPQIELETGDRDAAWSSGRRRPPGALCTLF